MRYQSLSFLILGFITRVALACNEISAGLYNSPDIQCYIDPDDGSNYGVAVGVQNPCATDEIIYLSLSYTFPGGSETRTVTSAQMGTQSPFTTTFTFNIPQTYFSYPAAVITQTFQIDNSPSVLSLRSTKYSSKTLFFTTRGTTSTIYSQVTVPTPTYTMTYTDTSYPQVVRTSNCNTGTLTRTTSTTETFTFTDSPRPVTVFASSTTTSTQSVRCTAANGQLPPNFKPRLGDYETDLCYNRYGSPTATTYSTGPTSTTVITSTLTYEPLIVWKYTTLTTVLPTSTVDVCNSPAATTTTTLYRSRWLRTTPVTTTGRTTLTSTKTLATTVAPSVC